MRAENGGLMSGARPLMFGGMGGTGGNVSSGGVGSEEEQEVRGARLDNSTRSKRTVCQQRDSPIIVQGAPGTRKERDKNLLRWSIS